MLLVKTFLAVSNIPGAGLGLFAAETIAQGTLIWRFDKDFDVLTDLFSLPDDPDDSFLRYVITHGFLIEHASGRGFYCFCIDDARFINHSSTPNLFDEPIYTTEGRVLAGRAISKGEELLSDYNCIGPADPTTGWKPGDGHTIGPRAAAFLGGQMSRDEFLHGARPSPARSLPIRIDPRNAPPSQ